MRILLVFLALCGLAFGECRMYSLKSETISYNGYAYFAKYKSLYDERVFSSKGFPPTTIYWSPEYGTACHVGTGQPLY